MSYCRLFSGLLVALCTLSFTPALSAQPMAERVPGDAVLYVGWQGTDDAGAAYANSHLKSVLDETRLRQLLVEVLPTVLQDQPLPPRARRMVDSIVEASPALWNRPWSLYLSVPANERGGMQRMHGVLTIDAGEQRERVQSVTDQLQMLWQENAGRGAPPMRVDVNDDTITITIGNPPADDIASLAANERFQGAHDKLPGNAMGVIYLDLARVMELATQAPHSPVEPRMLRTLGLDGLEQLIVSTGPDGKRWQTHAFVHAPGAPGNRRGLLKMLEGEPIEDDLLRHVPRNATWMTALRFDASSIWDGALEIAEQFEPRAAQEMRDGMSEVSMQLGVDLETDLIDGLGPAWLVYQDPDVAGHTPMGTVIVNPLRKPDAVADALSHLERLGNQYLVRAQERERDMPFRWRLVQQQHGDMTIHSAVLPLVSPSWTVHEDRLYISLLPQSLMQVTESQGESILDNLKFAAMRTWIEDNGELSSISFVDLERLAPHTYSSYLGLMQTAPAAAVAFGGDGPVSMLPPLSKLMPHLGPAGGATWTDADGLHWHWTSPFPGSTALSRQPLGGMLSNPGSLMSTEMVAMYWLFALQSAEAHKVPVQYDTHSHSHGEAVIVEETAPAEPAEAAETEAAEDMEEGDGGAEGSDD